MPHIGFVHDKFAAFDSLAIHLSRMHALRVTNVSKNFGAAAALRNVSFDLERGKILRLVGANGGSKNI